MSSSPIGENLWQKTALQQNDLSGNVHNYLGVSGGSDGYENDQTFGAWNQKTMEIERMKKSILKGDQKVNLEAICQQVNWNLTKYHTARTFLDHTNQLLKSEALPKDLLRELQQVVMHFSTPINQWHSTLNRCRLALRQPPLPRECPPPLTSSPTQFPAPAPHPSPTSKALSSIHTNTAIALEDIALAPNRKIVINNKMIMELDDFSSCYNYYVDHICHKSTFKGPGSHLLGAPAEPSPFDDPFAPAPPVRIMRTAQDNLSSFSRPPLFSNTTIHGNIMRSNPLGPSSLGPSSIGPKSRPMSGGAPTFSNVPFYSKARPIPKHPSSGHPFSSDPRGPMSDPRGPMTDPRSFSDPRGGFPDNRGGFQDNRGVYGAPNSVPGAPPFFNNQVPFPGPAHPYNPMNAPPSQLSRRRGT